MVIDAQKLLVPDYGVPQALIVPHGNFTILPTLERIAEEASRYIGVILLSSDPVRSRAFVARCALPRRFSIVAAPFDTPWIRDRSPIPVGDSHGYQWLSPNTHMAERELDSKLFNSITHRTLLEVNLVLPQGNLIGGPHGLALSTDRILEDNRIEEIKDLVLFKEQLGIREWLLVHPLVSDHIGHADCYVRFLAPGLMALAHDPDITVLTETMEILKNEVRTLFPHMEFISLPVCMRDGMLESSLNWIQIEELLLVPLFPKTTSQDRDKIQKILEEHSFNVVFVPFPTSKYGGALHCLTASVFS